MILILTECTNKDYQEYTDHQDPAMRAILDSSQNRIELEKKRKRIYAHVINQFDNELLLYLLLCKPPPIDHSS